MPPADFVDPAAGEDDEVAAMFDLKMKKKKKKKKIVDETGEAGGQESGASAAEGVEGAESMARDVVASSSSSGTMEIDPPIYTYGQMLNRVVDLLHQNNPEMLEKRKYTMKPPQLMRGT